MKRKYLMEKRGDTFCFSIHESTGKREVKIRGITDASAEELLCILKENKVHGEHLLPVCEDFLFDLLL